MKKMITILLAAVMTATLSLTAFAADTSIGPTTDPKTGSTAVTYKVEPAYIVTIPGTVELGKAATISAANVVVAKGKQIEVRLDSTSATGNAFKVKTIEGAELAYEVTIPANGVNPIAIGDSVLAVNPAVNASGSVSLSFSAPAKENIAFSGDYTGTITFAVSVEAVS